jgi:hypothetical protein
VPKLLSGTIARRLGQKLGPHVKPATLIKLTPTARTPGSPSAGLNPTQAEYAARGWIEEWEDGYVESSTTRKKARKVALLGGTIAGGKTPTPNDKVRIEGVTYTVTGIAERDPDAAVWVLNVVG